MTSDFSIQEVTLGIIQSLEFDKESMLNDLYESSGLPLDVFLRYIVLEEHPVTITKIDNHTNNEVSIRISQEFRVRMKTPEELFVDTPELLAARS